MQNDMVLIIPIQTTAIYLRFIQMQIIKELSKN